MSERSLNLEPGGDPFGDQAQKFVEEVPELTELDSSVRERIVDMAAMMLLDAHNRLADQPAGTKFIPTGLSVPMPDNKERVILALVDGQAGDTAPHLEWISNPLEISESKELREQNPDRWYDI